MRSATTVIGLTTANSVVATDAPAMKDSIDSNSNAMGSRAFMGLWDSLTNMSQILGTMICHDFF
jgi:hypothetical protein